MWKNIAACCMAGHCQTLRHSKSRGGGKFSGVIFSYMLCTLADVKCATLHQALDTPVCGNVQLRFVFLTGRYLSDIKDL